VRAEVPFRLAIRLQTQQPADEKEDGDQEHAKYSHTPNSQMDRREEFGSCSLLTPFSGYCAPEMRSVIPVTASATLQQLQPRFSLQQTVTPNAHD
jgi:hypothetical protein